MQCLANNNESTSTPFLTSAASVSCQVCTANLTADRDPRSGRFSAILSWGRNYIDGEGFSEPFDFYKVLMTDKYGKSYGEVRGERRGRRFVLKGASSKGGCCPDAYTLPVKGRLINGVTHLMIVPVESGVQVRLGAAGGRPSFELPIGKMVPLSDTIGGAPLKVAKGSLNIAMDNAALFAYSEHAEAIMSKSIADGLQGIQSGHVDILNIEERRRLLTEMARQLQSSIKVDFEVSIPADYAGGAIAAGSFDTAAISSSIETFAAEVGLTVKVSSIKVSSIQTVTLEEASSFMEASGAASWRLRQVTSFLVLALLAGLLQ